MCWKADKREEDEDSVACWPVFNTALQRHGFVSGVLGYLRPASGRDPGLAGLSMWAQVESVVSELSLGIPQGKETTSYRRLFFHRTLSTCKQIILCLSGLCWRDINSLNFEVLLRITNTSERLFKTKVMFLLYMELPILLRSQRPPGFSGTLEFKYVLEWHCENKIPSWTPNFVGKESSIPCRKYFIRTFPTTISSEIT